MKIQADFPLICPVGIQRTKSKHTNDGKVTEFLGMHRNGREEKKTNWETSHEKNEITKANGILCKIDTNLYDPNDSREKHCQMQR